MISATVHQQVDTPSGQPVRQPAMHQLDHSPGLAELSASLLQAWCSSSVSEPWLNDLDMLREIGRRVVQQESQVEPIPGHNWVVVRMDANAYDPEMRALRHDAVLESHNSPRCSECMTTTLKHMMEMFTGVVGFAHHSEIVFVIPPTQEDFHKLHNDAAIIHNVNVFAVVRLVCFVYWILQ